MNTLGRVTLREIAKVAGVSHVTVSFALRNHPSIPPATRNRIKAIARKMKYRPDPVLSALGTYRLSRQRVHYQATLAWVDAGTKDQIPFHKNPVTESYYTWKAAQTHAATLGYQIEVFRPIEMGIGPERLSQIFRNRQIQGIIFAPLPIVSFSFEMDWDWFSVVTLGFSHSPKFHILCSAQYRNARLAVRSLRQLGYQRIGLVNLRDIQSRTDMNITAGAWAEVEENGGELSWLNLPLWPKADCSKQLSRWIRQKKPDALLSGHAPELSELLAHIGISTPGNMALATLSHVPGVKSDIAGIDQRADEIGESAVNQLSSMLHRNERGLPKQPLQILIDGRWIDAPSAPSKK